MDSKGARFLDFVNYLSAGPLTAGPTVAAPHLSLIVPVYNGADRLPASLEELRVFLRALPFSWELILVDDCSNSVTRAILEQFAASMPEVRLIRNEENRGKGYAVTRGMRAAVGAYRVFTDADLAYPATEVGKILADL